MSVLPPVSVTTSETAGAATAVTAGLAVAPDDARLQALRDLIQQQQDEQDNQDGGQQNQQADNSDAGDQGDEGDQGENGDQPPPDQPDEQDGPEAEADQTGTQPPTDPASGDAPPPPAAGEPDEMTAAQARRRQAGVVVTLRVRLRESDDDQADQARLNEIMRLVREAPGDHPAYLTVDSVGERVTLELPPCTASWALAEALNGILAEHGQAEIEALPAAVAGA